MAVFDTKQRQDLKKYMEDGKMAEELSSTKIEQLNKMPIVESRVMKKLR